MLNQTASSRLGAGLGTKSALSRAAQLSTSLAQLRIKSVSSWYQVVSSQGPSRGTKSGPSRRWRIAYDTNRRSPLTPLRTNQSDGRVPTGACL